LRSALKTFEGSSEQLREFRIGSHWTFRKDKDGSQIVANIATFAARAHS